MYFVYANIIYYMIILNLALQWQQNQQQQSLHCWRPWKLRSLVIFCMIQKLTNFSQPLRCRSYALYILSIEQVDVGFDQTNKIKFQKKCQHTMLKLWQGPKKSLTFHWTCRRRCRRRWRGGWRGKNISRCSSSSPVVAKAWKTLNDLELILSSQLRKWRNVFWT